MFFMWIRGYLLERLRLGNEIGNVVDFCVFVYFKSLNFIKYFLKVEVNLIFSVMRLLFFC